MATPKQRGAAKERELVRMLEAEGFLVFRSAMSGGPYDLIAMKDRELRLIQVKRRNDRRRRAEPRFLAELAAATPRSRSVQVLKELWVWIERDAWHVTRVEHDGAAT
jgi:Holliday junction resolvase